MAAVEITRVGQQVDPSSKGWGPSQKPDEWKIVVLLSDTPNRAWNAAWEKAWPTALRGTELDAAEWEYKQEEQRIEIWSAEDAAERLIAQLDDVLDQTNKRCAEIVDQGKKWRAERVAAADDDRAEAARLQERLDSI